MAPLAPPPLPTLITVDVNNIMCYVKIYTAELLVVFVLISYVAKHSSPFIHVTLQSK